MHLKSQPCLKAPFKRGRANNTSAMLATEKPPLSSKRKLVTVVNNDEYASVILRRVFNTLREVLSVWLGKIVAGAIRLDELR